MNQENKLESLKKARSQKIITSLFCALSFVIFNSFADFYAPSNLTLLVKTLYFLSGTAFGFLMIDVKQAYEYYKQIRNLSKTKSESPSNS